MNCIVIAKLIGLLNNEPVDFYKLDCFESNHYVILKENQFQEVQVLNINEDLTYNIKEI